MSAISIAGNHTSLKSYGSITDFALLNKFNISLHPFNAPSIKEVIWHPPLYNSTKCNIDDSTTYAMAAYGGVFRNSGADFVGTFAELVGL